jgi:hypothetical protein
MGEAIAFIGLLVIFLVIFILGDMHRKAAIKDEQDLAEEEKLEKVRTALGRDVAADPEPVVDSPVEADPGTYRP